MKLKPKSVAEVMAVTDMSDLYPGLSYMVKAIKKIYPIIKDEISLLKLDYANLDKKDIPQLFTSIMDAADKISNDENRFKIKLVDDEYVIQKYRFHEFDESTLYGVSISFLPELRNYNQDLHDLFCACLSVLVEKNVPLIDPEIYDMDMELEMIQDTLSSERAEENEHLAEELDSFILYKDEYRKILRIPISVEKIEEMIELKTIPESLKDGFSALLPYLYSISLSNHDMHEISRTAVAAHAKAQDIDEEGLFSDGNPVELLQMFRILWFSDSTYIDYLCDWLGESSGNFGELLPMNCKDCHTAEEFKSVDTEFDDMYGTLCEDLAEVMSQMKDLTEDIIEYLTKCKKRKKFLSQPTYSLFTAEEVTEPIT
jgi:hypothetical protein